MGASLLVFANKTDVDDCMSDEEIQEVRQHMEVKQYGLTAF